MFIVVLALASNKDDFDRRRSRDADDRKYNWRHLYPSKLVNFPQPCVLFRLLSKNCSTFRCPVPF